MSNDALTNSFCARATPDTPVASVSRAAASLRGVWFALARERVPWREMQQQVAQEGECSGGLSRGIPRCGATPAGCLASAWSVRRHHPTCARGASCRRCIATAHP
jgi:hypothetical protein